MLSNIKHRFEKALKLRNFTKYWQLISLSLCKENQFVSGRSYRFVQYIFKRQTCNYRFTYIYYISVLQCFQINERKLLNALRMPLVVAKRSGLGTWIWMITDCVKHYLNIIWILFDCNKNANNKDVLRSICMTC